MTYTLINSEVIQWLKAYDGPRFHAVFGDPPYALGSMTKRFGKADSTPPKGGVYQRSARGFMGKKWDGFSTPREFQSWVTEWAELLIERAVYPGAMGLFFGGTRTFHRLACGLEDAGWQIVDVLAYMYGSGFPKNHNISKNIDRKAGVKGNETGTKRAGFGKRNGKTDAEGGIFFNSLPEELKQVPIISPATPDGQRWNGYGTALKPAYEPVILCRAPRGDHTFADLALEYGTGALNIDGCRIESEQVTGWGENSSNGYGGYESGESRPVNGRWPANVLLGCTCAGEPPDPDCPVRLLDEQSGESTSGIINEENGSPTTDGIYGTYNQRSLVSHGDTGGASRFFFTSKAQSWEREAGLESRTARNVNDGRKSEIDNPYQRGETKRRNVHPTVKPIQLTNYLARLLLPPDLPDERRILIPFAGVASEMIGALYAGWDQIVGVEMGEEYADIGKRRLTWWSQWADWDHAKRAYDAEHAEQVQRDTERQHGLEQLGLFDSD